MLSQTTRHLVTSSPTNKDIPTSKMRKPKRLLEEELHRLLSNHDEWRREVLSQDELFLKLYSHLPKELIFQRELLVARL